METTPRKQPEPRILARQLARPLTPEETEIIAGGLRPSTDTCSCTGCPVNDSDS